MARGLGFWVVVMIIMTSVLTREHLLGDHYKIMIIAIAMQWPMKVSFMGTFRN